jgi:hypothetical protein
LLLNRERIEFAFEKARANGLDDPIILVLDLQDERAARVARQTGLPWETIERCRRECQRCDVVPAQLISAPRWAVTCVTGPRMPNGSKGDDKASPPGTFRVVTIAAGGNSFADFPMPPDSHVAPE